MRLLIVFMLLQILPATAISQELYLEWAHTFGNEYNDYGRSVAIDEVGNVYVTGDFSGTVDFDPGPGVFNLTSNGHFDGFLLKLDNTGKFLWAIHFGSVSADQGRFITIDKSGNLVLTGSFVGTVDFDPGAGSYTLSTGEDYVAQSFICKYDSNGNLKWAKAVSAEFRNSKIDTEGNILVTGNFSEIIDFDPGPSEHKLTSKGFTGIATGVPDAFVLKLSQDGVFVWVKQIGGSGMDWANSLALDASNNIIIAGSCNSAVDFDPGPGVVMSAPPLSYTNNGFVLKLDRDGNYVWHFRTSDDIVYNMSVAVDAMNNIYVGGYFGQSFDADPGPGTYALTTSSLAADLHIVKLDQNGGFVWARSMGGVGEEFLISIALDAEGSVYATGNFRNTADFDPGPSTFNLTAEGYDDCFIVKLDKQGDFQFAISAGSWSNSDSGMFITVDNLKNIYTTGYFWGKVDFDPGPGNDFHDDTGMGDIFIQKLSQCQNKSFDTLSVAACNNYTVNGITYQKTGTYTQIIRNQADCDSIITIQLQISGSDSTTKIDACESYYWQGTIYTSSGVYSKTFTNTAGCDSIMRVDLTIRHTVTTTVDATVCEGGNYKGYTKAGVYTQVYQAVNGCDSIEVVNLDMKSRSIGTVDAVICEGETLLGRQTSGIYTDTLVNAAGCDSIRVLNLKVNPRKYTQEDVFLCEGQSYFAGGAERFSAGAFQDTLKTIMGCDSIHTTYINVHPVPTPDLGPDRNLCAGDSLILSPGSFASYNWQNGSVASYQVIHSAGIYSLEVTDSNNCTATDTLTIKSLVPLPVDFLNPFDSICRYDKLTISSKEIFRYYEWSNGSRQPEISITKPGLYVLTAEDENGCRGTDSIEVYAKTCNEGFYIPSAFTPNGDGKNDIFRPLLFGKVKKFKLLIFNRWGQIVFQSEDPGKGWDGKLTKVEQGNFVYVWTCSYQLEGESEKFEKGHVMLMR